MFFKANLTRSSWRQGLCYFLQGCNAWELNVVVCHKIGDFTFFGDKLCWNQTSKFFKSCTSATRIPKGRHWSSDILLKVFPRHKGRTLYLEDNTWVIYCKDMMFGIKWGSSCNYVIKLGIFIFFGDKMHWNQTSKFFFILVQVLLEYQKEDSKRVFSMEYTQQTIISV